jgi:tRNA A37 threonylcarbamoyladenosine dehydratase
MKFTTRNTYLLGEEKIELLGTKHVAVFGVGGVGSFVCEALVRTGIGEISLIDFDRIDITNLNRQLMTSTNNIGQLKVDVLKERLSLINPDLKINCYPMYFNHESELDFSKFDYVVDAIDSVDSKCELLSNRIR